MKTITQAIRRAERLLPGTPAPEGKRDPRWEAIIAIGNYTEGYPDDVWQFVEKWGSHPSQDLRSAIATCLLEHLLQYHFDRIFPLVEEVSLRSKRFAETFGQCWKFGQTLEPKNQKRLDALKKMIQKQGANKRVHRIADKPGAR